jgi:hypothetical protein
MAASAGGSFTPSASSAAATSAALAPRRSVAAMNGARGPSHAARRAHAWRARDAASRGTPRKWAAQARKAALPGVGAGAQGGTGRRGGGGALRCGGRGPLRPAAAGCGPLRPRMHAGAPMGRAPAKTAPVGARVAAAAGQRRVGRRERGGEVGAPQHVVGEALRPQRVHAHCARRVVGRQAREDGDEAGRRQVVEARRRALLWRGRARRHGAARRGRRRGRCGAACARRRGRRTAARHGAPGPAPRAGALCATVRNVPGGARGGVGRARVARPAAGAGRGARVSGGGAWERAHGLPMTGQRPTPTKPAPGGTGITPDRFRRPDRASPH